MSDKISVITSSDFGSDTYFRALAFAKSLKKMQRKVSFIANPLPGVFFGFIYSFIRFFRIIFSSKTAIVFNPCVKDVIPFIIRKIFGAKVIVDVHFPSKCFAKKTFTGAFFLSLSKKITYSNKNIPLVLEKNYPGLICDKFYNLKTGGNGLDILCEEDKGKIRKLKVLNPMVGTKKIVYAGSLDNVKVVDEVLEAFSIISDYADDVKFILAGALSSKSRSYIKYSMKNLSLKDKVIFTNGLYPCELKKLILESDILVDFLRREKQDYFLERIFVREALNMGKPIVCTDCGELILFKDVTYQSQPDQVLLVEVLSGIFANGSDEREEGGPQFIKENFNYLDITKKFLEDMDI